MDERTRTPVRLALVVLAAASLAPAAAGPVAAEIDLDTYRRFLVDNAGTTAADLQARYGGDRFAASAATDLRAASFADSVAEHFGLTSYEELLLERHGFVVTERVHPSSFGGGFLEVYEADLPVFIATDAVLHALHMSYDAILRDLETGVLLPALQRSLAAMHAALPELAQRHAEQPALAPMLADVDVYLTVARRLLAGPGEPLPTAMLAGTGGQVDGLLTNINRADLAPVVLFGAPRWVDFSQFTPRGHYTQDPELTRYFRAMMWLGRTELYLDVPVGAEANLSPEQLTRQTIDALLLEELATRSGADADLSAIDRLLTAFVGAQDNLTLAELREVRVETGVDDPVALLDPAVSAQFRARAAARGTQRILAQVLFKDPLSTERVAGAPAFLLLGQRFLVDAYVFANVVYDKIPGEVFRGLPSSLDALFALGNDPSIQLLDEELTAYGYAPNLAALRYLVDAQDAAFWEQSLYNGWLQAIRTLNPPADRSGLPPFMQTQAWWLQKMNTQLAAWAQLRHDNLLYAKQSYTVGVTCFYPATYVEPVPAFYAAVGRFADHAGRILGDTGTRGAAPWVQARIARYFEGMAAIADTLGAVARKELAGTPFTEAETRFLQTVVYSESSQQDCGPRTFGGWYTRLFYGGGEDLLQPDLVIADVHTQPTDEGGSMVGKVLHVGTGPLDLAVVVAQTPGRGAFAFAGPVLSFQEHVTLDFERLTDEQWQGIAREATPSLRPDLVNLYLADREGSQRGDPRQLATAVAALESPAVDDTATAGRLEAGSHPNPFNGETLIRFRVAPARTGQRATLTIYNAAGQAVRALLDEALPAGAYAARWDGTDAAGAPAASGTYLFRLRVGEAETTGRMTLLR